MYYRVLEVRKVVLLNMQFPTLFKNIINLKLNFYHHFQKQQQQFIGVKNGKTIESCY